MKKAPALVLALPRSGTNWTVDVIKESDCRILMEPFWLHNMAGYEQNPLHPMRHSSEADISEKYGHLKLENDPYGALQVKNLFKWLAFDDRRPHLIKETDGFFHLEWLLKSIPELKVLFISRDIRGNIASFKKGDLFNRWRYRTRLQNFLRTIHSNPSLDTLYGGLLDSTFISSREHVALANYLGICILEIRRHISSLSNCHEVSYENLVGSPQDAFRSAFDYLGLALTDGVRSKIERTTSENRSNHTHSTHKLKDAYDFRDTLTLNEAADIEGIWKLLGLDLDIVRVRAYFGTHLSANQKLERDYSVLADFDRTSLHKEYLTNSVRSKSEKGDFSILNHLVTNLEYSQFLNWLMNNGLPISINGRNLFYNDRPQSKIHIADDSCFINKGFEDHPATHMNALGAASFAFWIGARLPRLHEIIIACFPDNSDSTVSPDVANFGHHYPGTTSVYKFSPNSNGIYDSVGNTSVWIAEKYNMQGECKNNFEYIRACGAWSHGISECMEKDTAKGRPWWLAASTLGVRPVFVNTDLPEESFVLESLSRIIDLLESSSLSIDEKNQLVYSFIEAKQ